MKFCKIFVLLILFSMTSTFFGTPLTPNKAIPTQSLVFWTTETDPSRMAIIEGIGSRFPGANVQVVGVPENDLPETVAAAKASGTLPDILQTPYEYIGGYVDEGILDAMRATATLANITDLGGLPLVENPGSTSSSDKYGAVPIDGWIQGIWYRKDLFAANGLNPPDNFTNILTAAQTLHNLSDSLNPMYGMVIGTHPEAVYTQQVYEHFALANGARALDVEGKIVLNSVRQRETLEYYTNLSQYAPAGFNNWDTANELYLTNKCAMMIYSTFIADDIIGLQARPWTPIPELANKTSFQTVIAGFHDENASYGQLTALGITVGADAVAEDFVQFILNNDSEYLEWIYTAIAGKLPLKQTPGILVNWSQHVLWGSYEAGFAGDILAGFNSIARWGLIEGKSYSTKIATLYSELFVPKAIQSVISGSSTVATALSTAENDFYLAFGLPAPIFLSPSESEVLSGFVDISWTESLDNLGLSVTYNFSISTDGITWTLIASDLSSPSFLWNSNSVDDGFAYFFQVGATSAGGLSSSVISATSFTIDNTPPLIAVVSPLAQTYSSDTITLTFSGAATHYWYFIDSIDSQNNTWTASVTRTLPDGTYTLHVYGNDSVGNVAHLTVTFTIESPTSETTTTTTTTGTTPSWNGLLSFLYIGLILAWKRSKKSS